MAEDRTYRNQIGLGDRGAYSRFLAGRPDDEANALAFLKSTGRPFTTAEQAAAKQRALQDKMVQQGVGTAVGAKGEAAVQRGTTNQGLRATGTASALNRDALFDQPAPQAAAPQGAPALEDLSQLMDAASYFQPGAKLGPEGRAMDIQSLILEQLARGGR